MDNTTKYVILYDYYGELFTPKQKKYFEDYYFNNFSITEISENENISRNAVFKQIKYVENKLNYYEEKLEIYKRNKKIEKLVDCINDNDLKSKIIDLL